VRNAVTLTANEYLTYEGIAPKNRLLKTSVVYFYFDTCAYRPSLLLKNKTSRNKVDAVETKS